MSGIALTLRPPRILAYRAGGMSDDANARRRPWIETHDEDDTDLDPELADLYAAMRDPRGHVDNILKIHSLHPKSLRVHADFYKLVMYGRSPLSRIQREMIAVAVSAANQCHY
jgi:alkylhydroperoxidase family enzyme